MKNKPLPASPRGGDAIRMVFLSPSGELEGGLLFIYLATTYLWSVLRTAPKSA